MSVRGGRGPQGFCGGAGCCRHHKELSEHPLTDPIKSKVILLSGPLTVEPLGHCSWGAQEVGVLSSLAGQAVIFPVLGLRQMLKVEALLLVPVSQVKKPCCPNALVRVGIITPAASMVPPGARPAVARAPCTATK